MTVKRSYEEIEEIVSGLGYKLLDEYTVKEQRRVVVINSDGYKWNGFISNLMKPERKISIFDISNVYVLENISLWLKINRPEYELCENNVYGGNTDKLRFLHNISKCQEYFYMSWSNISRNKGCSVCAGYQIGERTSLAYLRPDLVREWHPNNKLTPEETGIGSREKVYWICSTCGYGKNLEWLSIIYNRTKLKKGTNCPSCSGQVVSNNNRLSIIFPEIALEWDYIKNRDRPDDVSFGSDKKRWWICSMSHSYFASIYSRTRLGSGCPYCSGNVVSDDNRLSILYEKISSEWDYSLNQDSPYDFSYGSNEKKFWLCTEGHPSYLAKISHRTYTESGCPRCSYSKGEEKISKWLGYNNIFHISEKYFDDCRNILPLPFDFGIPYDDETWFLIEYHGPQHYEPVDFAGKGEDWAKSEFNKNKKRDKLKQKYCKDNDIPLLIIPYWDFDNIEETLNKTFFE